MVQTLKKVTFISTWLAQKQQNRQSQTRTENQGLSWADGGGPARGWAGPGRPPRHGPSVFDMMGRGPSRSIKF